LTYEITPQHFGFTPRFRWLSALGVLACYVLLILIFPPWSTREIVSGLLTLLVLEIWWQAEHNYSLQVDDDSVRAGGREIRKDTLRYVREFNRGPLRGGSRLVLSAHASAWVRLFRGGIEIPKGLPGYEQIKEKVFAWTKSAK
jgi:hypothetical protein